MRAVKQTDSEGGVTTAFQERDRVRNEGQSAQFARLMLGRKALLAERKKRLEKAVKIVEHLRMKQEEKQKCRDIVSGEHDAVKLAFA
eukprot:5988354-Pleurochrysis_carterae.AAC.1